MTPEGELHILNVTPQDGHSKFQCRTLHTLTGETQLSRSYARIIVSGRLTQCYFENHYLSGVLLASFFRVSSMDVGFRVLNIPVKYF